MTTEALQKRGLERQELLTELMSEAYERIQNAPEVYGGALTIAATVRTMGLKGADAFLGRYPVLYAALEFLDGEIIPAIAEFARADEERKALLAEFLSAVAEQFASGAKAGLQRKELEDPQLIFGASSAITEVPLES